MDNKPFIIMLFLMLGASSATGQEAPYKWNAGASMGMSGYLGDANASLLSHPGFTAYGSMRYIPNVRWAYRCNLGLATLQGDTRDLTNVLPLDQQLQFSATTGFIDAMAEFNFMPYGIGPKYQRLSRWSPYLALGIGLALSHCGDASSLAPTVPMGVGVKFKAAQRVNLTLEFVMTKVFSDQVDGKSLDDPLGIKSSFIKNTDWFSRFSVGLTYEWGERCQTCHYKD